MSEPRINDQPAPLMRRLESAAAAGVVYSILAVVSLIIVQSVPPASSTEAVWKEWQLRPSSTSTATYPKAWTGTPPTPSSHHGAFLMCTRGARGSQKGETQKEASHRETPADRGFL